MWGVRRKRSPSGRMVQEYKWLSAKLIDFFTLGFGTQETFGFWFLVCYAVTQLALQLPQERRQVVRSNKVAWKRLTESNGTPAMDLENGPRPDRLQILT